MDDNAHLDPIGVETLANNLHLGRLRHLDLSNNWFGVDGVAPLRGARWLFQLDRLELEGVGISDEGVELIAHETGFRALRVLNLVANSIGERGAQHILQSAWLRRLEELDLRDNMCESHIDNPITQQTAEALRHRFGDRIRL